MRNFYQDQTVVLATKHSKEQAISEIFNTELGIKLVTPDNIDTDSLGTFTGEVPRLKDMLETAR